MFALRLDPLFNNICFFAKQELNQILKCAFFAVI